MTTRQWLAPFAVGLLVAGVTACGGASRTTSDSTNATVGSGSSRAEAYDLQDADNDPDDRRTPGYVNDEESLFPTYGRGASPADTRAIATLVKRYLAAATSDEGTMACSLLDATLVRELAAAGSGEGSGDSCATALPALFMRQHPRTTAADVATMTVISVHVKGDVGLAELGFRTLPEQELIAEREGHTWKIDALLGNYMP